MAPPDTPHDRLRIEGLRFAAIIGVRDWERAVRQRIEIDIELAIDARRAASRDVLEDATDSGAIARRLQTLIDESAFHLIESLAEAVARTLIDELDVKWTCVTVHKPGAISHARDVTITIERGDSRR